MYIHCRCLLAQVPCFTQSKVLARQEHQDFLVAPRRKRTRVPFSYYRVPLAYPLAVGPLALIIILFGGPSYYLAPDGFGIISLLIYLYYFSYPRDSPLSLFWS